MTIQEARETFKPATAVEVELLTECVMIANDRADGGAPAGVGDILFDAWKFWSGPGRSICPSRWKARVNAARRMLDRAAIGSR